MALQSFLQTQYKLRANPFPGQATYSEEGQQIYVPEMFGVQRRALVRGVPARQFQRAAGGERAVVRREHLLFVVRRFDGPDQGHVACRLFVHAASASTVDMRPF